MVICVFDTETTSLQKPFCYNIGYIVADVEGGEVSKILAAKNFVVEQVWHNPMLFSTAYYAEKRPIYVSEMRRRRAVLEKFGYITQEMCRDFKRYGVERAFAFNSDFDERVFDFNCDWFRCINPFDTVPISDIRGFVHAFMVDDDYFEFCEKYERFTDSGNYSTTAETVFQYINGQPDFIEEHTALADSEIELQILLHTAKQGADLNGDYPAKQSILRRVEKDFEVIHKPTKQILFSAKVYNVRATKKNTKIFIE